MSIDCMEHKELTCQSYPRCYGCNSFKNPTNYDRIISMTVDEMVEYFGANRRPYFPSSPCYVCDFDAGFFCEKDGCTDEYKKEVYKKWLEKEIE